MSTTALLEGVEEVTVQTPHFFTRVLHSGPLNAIPVVFIHGNLSSARFFEELLAALDPRLHAIAPDLRGFGKAQRLPIDATRGMRDFSDDLEALLNESSVIDPDQPVHLIGWSLGGGVAMQYTIDHPARVASVTLLSSMSPFGFGGTRDAKGTPCWDDFAGSGGGTVASELIERLGVRDVSAESLLSPRQVMRSLYVKSPSCFTSEREDVLVDELLDIALGDDYYPGDSTSSGNWPGTAPGTRGINNSISPKYCNLVAFSEISPKPDVLWVHGDDDLVVSDNSVLDFGVLGGGGIVPGWPGDDFPPQPMISQLRNMLLSYEVGGGRVNEERFEDCGHSPHLEHPERFRDLLTSFIFNADKTHGQ